MRIIRNDLKERQFAKVIVIASGKIGRHLQQEINLQVTHAKLNDARVKNLLDSIYKNVL